MPYRKTVFANDYIYHVFNKGVASVPIFYSPKNYLRFLDLVNYYRFNNCPISFSKFTKLPIEQRGEILDQLIQEYKIQIEVLAFCLMGNHFHLLIRQIMNKGVVTFMSNIQNGYVKYFNIKSERKGPLFQSVFKAVIVETDEQLLHVSRYIHLNPSTSYLVEVKDLAAYPWSSFLCYLKEEIKPSFVNSKFILNLFKNRDSYKNFVFNQVEYQKKLDVIKHLILE